MPFFFLLGLSWCGSLPAGKKSSTRRLDAFCHSSHSFSYFRLWQPPPRASQSFHQLPGRPSQAPPSLSEDGDAFWWFTSCLTGKSAAYVWRLLVMLANGLAVERRCLAARFPCKVGPAKNLRVLACVMCSALCY